MMKTSIWMTANNKMKMSFRSLKCSITKPLGETTQMRLSFHQLTERNVSVVSFFRANIVVGQVWVAVRVIRTLLCISKHIEAT